MTRVCCVVQCGSKSGSQENNASLFEINAESENYNMILNAVGANLKKNKTRPKTLFICELHFANDCIIRTDTAVMKDGSQVLVPRKRPRLMKNSIPSIFPNQTKEQEKIALAITEDHDYTRVKTRDLYTQKHLTEDWNKLMEDGGTPSHWTLCNSPHGIFFVYLGDEHKCPSRTILVKEDMSLEIRHHDRLANLPDLEKIENFQDFFTVLSIVTSFRICEGVQNIPCKNIFFIPRSKSNKCTDCQRINKHRKNIAWKHEKRARLKEKKNQILMAKLKRKYKLAANKV